MNRKRAFYLAESKYKQKAQNYQDEANETYTGKTKYKILYETRNLKVGNTGEETQTNQQQEEEDRGLNTQEGNEEIRNRSEHSWD